MGRVTSLIAGSLLYCHASGAQELPQPLSDPPSGREAFLAAAIGAMMACGLLSFWLRRRASERTHVALAMLVVLIGGFGLLVLFGGVLYRDPIVAVPVFLLLIALFRFMSRFESRRD